MGVTRGPSEGDVIRCEGLAERAVAPRGKKNAPEARASGAGMWLKRSGLLRQVLGAVRAQGVEHELGIRCGTHSAVQDNIARGDWLAVNACVGVVVRTHGRAGQRDSGEEGASARGGGELCAQSYLGPGRDGGRAAQLNFAG